MPIYEITNDEIAKIKETTFRDAGLKEREDLQRLLRAQIDVILPDTLVLAEEFSGWQDSGRRLDLLGLDKNANLVVFELKRTEDGGHMELQAVRYAAMVSTMTFDDAVAAHTAYLDKMDRDQDAQVDILEFLGWDKPNDKIFGQDVRIVLVSADFGKEVTTAVMWLNERQLDIRCVRLRPYRDGNRVLIDVQQVVPLPEATDYQVQLRKKEELGRKGRAESYDTYRKFWTGLLNRARDKTTLHTSISPTEYSCISATAGVPGLFFNYVITRQEGRVELSINRGDAGWNKGAFDTIHEHREEIEAALGGAPLWGRLDDKRSCHIKYVVPVGGYRNDESEWPDVQDAMINAMVRFEKALRPHLEKL